MPKGRAFLAGSVAAFALFFAACRQRDDANPPAATEQPSTADTTAAPNDASPGASGAGTDRGLLPLPSGVAGAGDANADHIVVEVNGQPIHAKKLLGAVEMNRLRAKSMGHTMTAEEGAQLREAALHAFVADELLYQAAKAEGIVAPAAQVAEEVKTLRAGFPNDAQYREFLQRAGMEENGVEEDAERRLVVRAYVKKLAGAPQIPETEARAFYDGNKEKFAVPEQVTASIIVVLSKPDDAEALRTEARKRIDEAHKKAAAGEDFAALAKQYSQIPNAANGGELGSFSRGDGLPPKIEDIAFSTEPGEISPVFDTPAGLCIIKTTAKAPAGTRPYDEKLRRLITEELGRQKEGAAVEARVAELRQTATIEIKDSNFFASPSASLDANR